MLCRKYQTHQVSVVTLKFPKFIFRRLVSKNVYRDELPYEERLLRVIWTSAFRLYG